MIDEVIQDALDYALNFGEEPSYRVHRGLSMSALGGCRKQGAYLWTRSPQEEREDNGRSAQVGTQLHAVLLPTMADALTEELGSTEYEVEVMLDRNGRTIPGTADLVLPFGVVDLKTVGRSSFNLLRAPRRKWRMQVTAAALALELPECAILMLDRDTGDSKVFAWATEDYVEELDHWLEEACQYPADVARDYRGPGIDKECDWCPFVRACWALPFDAKVGAAAQSVLVHDSPSAELMLANYVEATERLNKAADDKKFARQCLSGSESGQYGRFELTWTKRAGRTEVDQVAARALLEEAGLVVPIKEGQPSTYISVKQVSDD